MKYLATKDPSNQVCDIKQQIHSNLPNQQRKTHGNQLIKRCIVRIKIKEYSSQLISKLKAVDQES